MDAKEYFTTRQLILLDIRRLRHEQADLESQARFLLKRSQVAGERADTLCRELAALDSERCKPQ